VNAIAVEFVFAQNTADIVSRAIFLAKDREGDFR
jgi:hypothetical protein